MRKFISFIFGFFFLTATLTGQTVQELEQQRKNALKTLETTSKILSETKKNQRTSLNKLNILNKSIQQRTSLITNINKEINALDQEISQLNADTKRLEKQLEKLKADYARMVEEAYINRSIYAKIMFVLSAENFDQSFRRLRYLQEFTDYRKMQVKDIEKTQQQIEEKAKQLAQHKQTQVDIRSQKETEQKKLVADKKKENTALSSLKKKEKNLQSEIRKQQRIANELNKKIERLIAEEIRKAEEKARAEAQKSGKTAKEPGKSGTSTKSGTEYAMTKEQALISSNFAGNAGRLPWPVEKGFISGKFGVQAHPVLKHVTTNNKGIYIQSPATSNARAVFDGVVTQRFSVPGSNNGVIIQHGQYRTVYANLTNIYVQVGQKVTAKQSIGRIYTDPEDDNKTELFFQIWKDRTILNPESWISR